MKNKIITSEYYFPKKDIKLKKLLHRVLAVSEKKLISCKNSPIFAQKASFLSALADIEGTIYKLCIAFKLNSMSNSFESDSVKKKLNTYLKLNNKAKKTKFLIEKYFNFRLPNVQDDDNLNIMERSIQNAFSFRNFVYKNLQFFENNGTKKVLFSRTKLCLIFPHYSFQFRYRSNRIIIQKIIVEWPQELSKLKNSFFEPLLLLMNYKRNNQNYLEVISNAVKSIDTLYNFGKMILIDSKIMAFSKIYDFKREIYGQTINYIFGRFFSPYNELKLCIDKNKHIILQSTSLLYELPEMPYTDVYTRNKLPNEKPHKQFFFHSVITEETSIGSFLEKFKRNLIYNRLRNIYDYVIKVIRESELSRLFVQLICDHPKMYIEASSFMWGSLYCDVDVVDGTILISTSSSFPGAFSYLQTKVNSHKPFSYHRYINDIVIKSGISLSLGTLLGKNFMLLPEISRTQIISSKHQNIYLWLSSSNYYYLSLELFGKHPIYSINSTSGKKIPFNQLIQTENLNLPYYLKTIARSMYSLKLKLLLCEIERQLIQFGCHCITGDTTMNIFYPPNLTANLKVNLYGKWSLKILKNGSHFFYPGEFILTGNEITARFCQRIAEYIMSLSLLASLQSHLRNIKDCSLTQVNDILTVCKTSDISIFIGLQNLQYQSLNLFQGIYHVPFNAPTSVKSVLSYNMPIELDSTLNEMPFRAVLTTHIPLLIFFFEVFKSNDWVISMMYPNKSFTATYHINPEHLQPDTYIYLTMNIIIFSTDVIICTIPTFFYFYFFKFALTSFPIISRAKSTSIFSIKVRKSEFLSLKEKLEKFSYVILMLRHLKKEKDDENYLSYKLPSSSIFSIKFSSPKNSENGNKFFIHDMRGKEYEFPEKIIEILYKALKISPVIVDHISKILQLIHNYSKINETIWKAFLDSFEFHNGSSNIVIDWPDFFKILIDYRNNQTQSPLYNFFQDPTRKVDVSFQELYNTVQSVMA